MPGISATVVRPTVAGSSGEQLTVTSPVVELPDASVSLEVVGPQESVMAPDTPEALEPDDSLGLAEPVTAELVETAFGDEPWVANPGTGRPDLALATLDAADEGDRVSVQVIPRDGEDFIPGAVVAYRLRDFSGLDGTVPSWAGLTVDYGDFTDAYGGDYGGRLQLMVFPECALTTPEIPACVTGLPLTTTHHEDEQTLSAIVPYESPDAAGEIGSIGSRVAGGASSISQLLSGLGESGLAQDGSFGGGSIIAAVSGASSDTGTYTATKVEADGSWGVAEQSGAFTYSVPIDTVQASAGAAPQLALTYNSGAVDGANLETNSQSGWAGSGWSLQMPYIERLYRNCGKDGFTARATELCWQSQYSGDDSHAGYSIFFNGVTQELIWDATWDTYRLSEDDGTRVTLKTTGSNDDNNNEYFWVQTPDGSIYMFGYGLDEPGGTATNSVATVPVYGDDAGEPRCGGTAQTDYCNQGYRWMLDRVIDPNENASAYYYTREQNRYAMAGNPATTGYYTAAIYPKEIRYDYSNDTGPTTALARVTFTTQARCIGRATTSISPLASTPVLGSCPDRTVANAAQYPDTPLDLWCQSTCTSAQNTPAFFTTQRLDTVTTQYIVTTSGSRAWATAATFQPRFLLPDPTDTAPRMLWLRDVQTKAFGSPTTSTDDLLSFTTAFDAISLKNRVDWDSDTKAFRHLRISRVTTSLGATIDVTYKGSGSANMCPETGTSWSGWTDWFNAIDGHWDTNTKECYKVKFDPDGVGSQPAEWGIFHKYLVEKVVVGNIGGAAPDRVTSYEYLGTPAWAYQNSFVFARGTGEQHWNSWRGYGKVQVTTGTGADRSITTNQYFRGLNGDYRQDGSSASVTITPLVGDSTPVVDASSLAGQLMASVTTAATGSTQAAVRNEYAALTSIAGPPMHNSVDTRVTRASTFNRKDTSTSLREATTSYTYDAAGRVTQVATDPDVSTTGLESCTTTSYIERVTYPTSGTEASVANRNAWGGRQYMWRPDTVTTYDGTCTTGTVTGMAKYRYDGSTTGGSYGSWLTNGDLTAEVTYSDETHSATASATYDTRGRITAAWLPSRPTTQPASMTWTYAVQTDGAMKTVTTSAAGLSTSTWTDPIYGNTTRVTGADGLNSHQRYDALGRLTRVWSATEDGSSTAPSTQSPTDTYSYGADATPGQKATPVMKITSTDHPGVTTGGGNQTTYTYVNALGEAFQTQSSRLDGATGLLVSNTTFTDRGLTATTTSAQVRDTGSAGAAILTPDLTTVSSYTATTYDFAGRPVTVKLFGKAPGASTTSVLQTTSSTYAGDTTAVTAPTGATTTTVVDALGRTVSTALGPESGSAASHITGYSYSTLSSGATSGFTTQTVTDPDGKATTFTADWLGRRTSLADANAGTSTYVYDADGNVTTVHSEAGWIQMAYDATGRLISRTTSTTETGPAQSSTVWTYDANGTLSAPGQVLKTATTTTDGSSSWTYTTEVSELDTKKRPTKTKVTLPTLTSLGAFSGSTYETAVRYDALGRVDQTTLPAVAGVATAEAVTTGFDQYGQPATLTASGAGSIMTAATYTADGLTASRSLANSVTRTIEWDPTYRTPTRLLATQNVSGTQTTRQDDTYVRDGVGRITSIVDDVADVRQCYTYEAFNRLSAAWTQSAATSSATCSTSAPTDSSWDVGTSAYKNSWTYSPAGSIASRVQAAHSGASTTEAYTYADASSPAAVTKTTSTAAGAYVYDTAGRMTARPGQTLTWDVLSNLTKLVAGSTTTTYLYDDAGQRYAEITPAKVTIYQGVWEATDPSPSTTSTTDVAVTRYYTAGGTQLASKTTGGTLLVMLGDIQGSAQLAIAATGTPTSNAYTPYGTKRANSTIASPHGWLNQVTDTTGLTYLNARYYDPTLGRFLSPDPLLKPGDPRTLDPYRYGDNNPITFTDPTGLEPRVWKDGHVTGVGGASYATEDGKLSSTKPINLRGSKAAQPELPRQKPEYAPGRPMTPTQKAVTLIVVGAVIVAGCIFVGEICGPEGGALIVEGVAIVETETLVADGAINTALEAGAETTTETGLASAIEGAGLDLEAAEEAGGHTLARHVGMSDQALIDRNIPQASTFTDQASAQSATAQNLSSNADAVDEWLAGSSPRLAIQDSMDPAFGRVYDRATQAFLKPTRVNTVLERTPSGYNVLTSYPIP
jgi:RHS repeat-associated protein